MVAPVSGLAQAGPQLASDRYTYLPSLALAMLVGAGCGRLLVPEGFARRAMTLVAAAGLAVSFGVSTWHQVQVWHDSGTLWSHAIDVEPECAVCHAHLGFWLSQQGKHDAAIAHLRTAVSLRPSHTPFDAAHAFLGLAFLNADRPHEAIPHFAIRLAKNPNDLAVLIQLGVALIRQGRYDEARATLGRALEINPGDSRARAYYATAIAYLGERDEALSEYRRALDAAFDDAAVRYAYASALVRFGDVQAARAHLHVLGTLDSKLAAQLAREISQSHSATADPPLCW